MAGPPDVSVIIPARDAAAYLGEALDSLLAQDFSGWEALVVENGSTDDTAAIAEGYAARDARIRLLRSRAAGVSAARNEGLAAAAAPWVLFLDADDLLTPDALSAMTARLREDPSLDAAYCGWSRFAPDGERTFEHPRVSGPDLLGELTRRCAFAMHACVVRRDVVLAAGGFDEALRTGEDWDLWVRVARAGARFGAVPGHHALYRMRAASASNDPDQSLDDAIVVLERAHAGGGDPAALATAVLGFCAWTSGAAIAAGRDPMPLLDRVRAYRTPALDPQRLAWAVFDGALPVVESGPGAWARGLRDEHDAKLRALAEAFEAHSGAPALAARMQRRFDRRVAAAAPATAAVRAGTMDQVVVHADRSLVDVEPQPGAEHILVSVLAGGEPVGRVELPVCTPVVPAWLLADAIAAGVGWRLVTCFLERTVERFAHGDAAWGVFLEEAFGRAGGFYDPRADWGEVPVVQAGSDGRARIDIAAGPQAAAGAANGLVVACAGEDLGVLATEKADLTAGEVVGAICHTIAGELAPAVARAALIGRPWDAPLAELLRRAASDAAAAAPPPTAAAAPPVLLARRAPDTFGLSHSRRAVLPGAAAAELAAAARLAGEPVLDVEPGARLVAYDPARIPPDARPPAASGTTDRPARADTRHDFEALFARSPDPWGYTSEYETRKYAHTLELLPDPPIRAVLEVGCAEGHFTVELARRAERVVAMDISAIALARAAERCISAGLQNVAFVRGDLTTGELPSDLDAIVCSEVLYYVGDRAALRAVARRLAAALRAGGVLVHAHARLVADDPGEPGFDWGHEFGGRAIGDALAATPGLRLEEELDAGYYRVQRLRRTTRRFELPRRPRRRTVEAAPPPPEVARAFFPRGGRPGPPPPPPGRRLPILMYHRVAPECPEAARRWCVTPEAFAEQLDYLLDAGYRTTRLDDWQRHALAHQPLDGRRVVITFDDGYRDLAEHAWPALEARGLTALVFLPTGHVGATNAWDAGMGMDAELLGWDELRALEASGLCFGSHTVSHRPLTALGPAETVEELVRSRLALLEHLAAPLVAIAYPYGDVDPAVQHLAGACGYAFGLTCRAGPAGFEDGALDLPRVEVEGTDTLDAFIAKLT